MSEYQINVIYKVQDIAQLRDSWNRLLEKSASSSFFLTWEWVYSWAECYLGDSRKLFIIVVYDKDEVVGIAPWYVEYVPFMGSTRKQISFLGSPESGADYLDVFMKRGKEKEISNFIYEYIMAEASKHWHCMILNDIPSSSLFLMNIMNKSSSEGKYVELTRASFCPVTVLPDNIDKYFLSLSKNRREQYRRHLKMLSSSGKVSHESHHGNENTIIDEFFHLYKKNWKQEGDKLQRLIHILATNIKDHDRLQLDFLKYDGNYIAGLLHFKYQKSLLMYLMAIDKDFNPKISIGNVLVGLCIQQAINKGISTYDFLKGEEDYKFHWSTKMNVSNSIFLYQRRIIPLIFAMNRQLKHAGKLLLR